MHQYVVKSAYEKEPYEGYRVLVDRLWPRGVSRERLAADVWAKELCPSNALRRDFHAGKITAEAFEKAYIAELEANPELEDWKQKFRDILRREDVCLITAAREEHRVHPGVLIRVLES